MVSARFLKKLVQVIFVFSTFIFARESLGQSSSVYQGAPIHLDYRFFNETYDVDPSNPSNIPVEAARQFNKSLSNLQLIKLAADNLVRIMESYQQQNSIVDSNFIALLETAKKFEDFQLKLRGIGYRNWTKSDWLIFAEISSKGRFKVEGVDQERLAINDGRFVYLNTLGLGKVQGFDFTKALILTMHEIFNYNSIIPLIERDRLAGEIGIWIESRTVQLSRPKQSKFIAVLINPQPPFQLIEKQVSKKILYETETFLDSVILIDSSNEQSRIADNIYLSFKSMKNGPPNPTEDLRFTVGINGSTYLVPFLTVKDISLSADDKLIIRYEFNSEYYFRETRNSDIPFKLIKSKISPEVNYYSAQYRVEFDLATDKLETLLLSSRDTRTSETAQFSLESIKKSNGDRFVSLILKSINGPDYAKNRSPILLSARSKQKDQNLQFVSVKLESIDRNSARAIFKIPDIDLAIEKLYIPNLPTSGFFYEDVLSSKQPINIAGSSQTGIASDFHVEGLSLKIVNPYMRFGQAYDAVKLKYPPTYLELGIAGTKKINYALIECYHEISWFNMAWGRPDGNTVLDSSMQPNLFVKNKYIYKIDSMNSTRKIKILAPLPIRTGYVQAKTEDQYKKSQIAWFDYGFRYISSVRLIFDDGTFEDLPPGLLPKEFWVQPEFEKSQFPDLTYPL